tara:strand:+ start:461 stop:1165 length:705 start_codon:yes stop_codon:yes gene_type:complete
MAGLGTVKEGGRSTFLTIAGGFIWDRKADASNPNYATQEFKRADGTVGERAGARYADLTGNISKVEFRTHPQYGENINVTIAANGDDFILSVSTNNRYSQDLMKALLNADLSQSIFIKPYDFIGKDKKRAMGVSFRQNGEKISLRVEGSPTQPGEWFKTAGSKNIKRFFEDLNEWFVNEVTSKVVGSVSAPIVNEVVSQQVAPQVAPIVEEVKATPTAKVADSDLDSQLDALLG